MRRILDRPEPILSYAQGGFRFARLTHSGSLLISPDGVFDWPVRDAAEFPPAIADLRNTQLVLGDFFLLGTGERQVFPRADVREAFDALGIGLEVLQTGSACRTYNLLLQEQRIFSAGLIAM